MSILFVEYKYSASYSLQDSFTRDIHYEKSNSSKYMANAHTAQLPVPKVVNTIIEAFTQTILPRVMPASGGDAKWKKDGSFHGTAVLQRLPVKTVTAAVMLIIE